MKQLTIYLLVLALLALAGCANSTFYTSTSPVSPTLSVATPTALNSLPALTNNVSGQVAFVVEKTVGIQWATLSLDCLDRIESCKGNILFLSGTQQTNIVTPAIWSPNGQQFLFLSTMGDDTPDIYIMNADGTGLANLTNTPESEADPVWSPDGKKIAFAQVKNVGGEPQSEILVMRSDGTDVVDLTKGCQPGWSPDGQQIVFISCENSSQDVYLMNVDGTRLVNLTNSLALESGPVFPSDGRKIMFSVLQENRASIYIMNIDGSRTLDLVPALGNVANPVWSPDGQQIAFVSSVSHTTPPEIYVINANGTNLINVSNSPGMNPAWSPNGEKLLFESGSNIFLVNADGSGRIQLTDASSGEAYTQPNWRP